ncbi:MFS transporter [Thiohalocapsa marina]|uniref:MFS transporter n=1 Tax=Thiohalocapsa marina TaxID=424902 RepID=A0A5M8FS46_9GAMM|nr:MFS transporter [Thiohalocapsa marina]KAA6184542.1 MFS transporter [Thiohalocapsa marina]
MGVRNLAIVIYCTLVAVAVLYAPQPLLPLLAEEWGRPLGETALLTTTTLVPLALGPLVYGYVLEHVSSKHMLILGFSVLTLAQFTLSLGPDYPLFFALRTFEGMVLPAILTALMTYSSSAGGPQRTRRNITIYIAATIAGGFSGRALSGVMTDLFDWQAAFLFWAGAALLATVLTTRLASDSRLRLGRVRFAEIRQLARRPVYAEGLLSAFLLFFVFAAVLNFLPFHMRDNDPEISQSAIALVYTGYLIGVVVALFSLRLIRLFGGERRTLVAGSLVYLLGTAAFALPGNQYAYLSMLVFAAGMFTLHSVLSAFLNHLERDRKGLVNGLYVSSYYAGGALGSFLPGFLYQGFGWGIFIAFLVLLVLGLIGLSLMLRHGEAPDADP